MDKINTQLQRQLKELKQQYELGDLTQQQYKRACIRAVKEAPEESSPANGYDAMESALPLKEGSGSGDYDVLGNSSGLRKVLQRQQEAHEALRKADQVGLSGLKNFIQPKSILLGVTFVTLVLVFAFFNLYA